MRAPTTIHSVDLRYVMRRCAITQIGSVCLFATLAGGIITACATGDQNGNGPGDDAGIVQPSSGVASSSGVAGSGDMGMSGSSAGATSGAAASAGVFSSGVVDTS